jgi:excisionase family DNA binding protein
MKRREPKHNDREQPQPAGDIMALREVAQYLHCHKITLYRLLRSGQIPAFQLRSHWRFGAQISSDG